MRKAFDATIRAGRGGGAFVEVPFDAKAEFGSARARVDVTFDGEPYRGTIAPMGGAYLIGILKEIRSRLGKDIGDTVHVTMQVDAAPREIAVPAEVAKALKGAGLTAAFSKLSYTHRKEYIEAFLEAKKPETRQRRIDRMLDDLGRGER
jgi:hypothetical protein